MIASFCLCFHLTKNSIHHSHTHLKKIMKAYYPEAGPEPVGGGLMDHQYVPRYSDFNFTYPFAIKYNAVQDTDRTLLHLLVQKCGLTGGQPQQLTINYVINLAVKVLFVTVHPTITDSTSFVCPVQSVSITTRQKVQLIDTCHRMDRAPHYRDFWQTTTHLWLVCWLTFSFSC